MEKLQIQANLSIERSGGAENLQKVIALTETMLKEKFPDANISVRKGFFQTIDGIWASDSVAERAVMQTVAEARKKVLNP